MNWILHEISTNISIFEIGFILGIHYHQSLVTGHDVFRSPICRIGSQIGIQCRQIVNCKRTLRRVVLLTSFDDLPEKLETVLPGSHFFRIVIITFAKRLDVQLAMVVIIDLFKFVFPEVEHGFVPVHDVRLDVVVERAESPLNDRTSPVTFVTLFLDGFKKFLTTFNYLFIRFRTFREIISLASDLAKFILDFIEELISPLVGVVQDTRTKTRQLDFFDRMQPAVVLFLFLMDLVSEFFCVFGKLLKFLCRKFVFLGELIWLHLEHVLTQGDSLIVLPSANVCVELIESSIEDASVILHGFLFEFVSHLFTVFAVLVASKPIHELLGSRFDRTPCTFILDSGDAACLLPVLGCDGSIEVFEPLASTLASVGYVSFALTTELFDLFRIKRFVLVSTKPPVLDAFAHRFIRHPSKVASLLPVLISNCVFEHVKTFLSALLTIGYGILHDLTGFLDFVIVHVLVVASPPESGSYSKTFASLLHDTFIRHLSDSSGLTPLLRTNCIFEGIEFLLSTLDAKLDLALK